MTRFARHRLPDSASAFVPQPVRRGRGAQVKADQGSRLSEPKASSRETPLWPSTTGLSYWGQTPISLRCMAPHPQGEPKAWRIGALTPKTPRLSGRLSFGYFSLAKQRQSASPAGARPGLLANRRNSMQRRLRQAQPERLLQPLNLCHPPYPDQAHLQSPAGSGRSAPAAIRRRP